VTGFVGFKTLLTALQAGHNVRAIIRKPSQSQPILSHVKIAPHASSLDFAIVPDLASDGAFDSVLTNVVAILHIANPLAVETENYKRDVIDPAIRMCTSILHSALKIPTVRRVVMCSSLVTLLPLAGLAQPGDKTYTANDINTGLTRDVHSPMEAYCNAKGLARVAVKEFVEKYRPGFSVVQILPGAIQGVDERATSVADLKANVPQWEMRMAPLLGETCSEPLVSVPVDVADVARAHVDAIKEEIVGNTDYALCVRESGSLRWNDMIEVAVKHFPKSAGSKKMPLGGTLPTTKWVVDSEATEVAFGWEFRTFEETMKDVIGQYLKFAEKE
jgi:nucleoside-diphosphate-sugar epimerase